jgi:ABC-2 type transport system permease protein
VSSWSLLLAETRLQTKIFFRTAVAAFFTLVMPVMFLVMISFFLGDEPGATQYVTPALAVFGMVTATFTNLAINTSMARDEGILKRVAGTPLPMILHLGGRIISAVLIGLISVAVMLLVGWALFDVVIPWPRMGVFALLLMLGAATFSALGLAVAAITPTSRAAPAIANFVVLPLAFISGVFFPLEGAPSWLRTVASLLPLEPMATAAIDTFDQTLEAGFPARATISLLVWGAVGLVVAVRFFSFEPAGGRPERAERAERAQSSTEMET